MMVAAVPGAKHNQQARFFEEMSLVPPLLWSRDFADFGLFYGLARDRNSERLPVARREPFKAASLKPIGVL